MSDQKTLRKRIQDGEVLVALRGTLNTTKSQLSDIWETGRYDYIWIDGQHTAFSEESLVAYCTAAEELGIDVQLRIPHTRHAYLVGRYLDLGCSAVLVPEVMEEETLADCLGGSIGLENKYTFKIAQDTIDDFVLIDEDKIAEGIKFNFEYHKLITEGAAATSIMVVKDQLSKHLGKNVICLICGGNIDAELFSKIIQ